MKSNLFVLLLCVGCAAALTACKPSDSSTTTGGASAGTGPAVELKPKWPVGNKYTYRMDMDQKTTVPMPNVPQPMQQVMTMAQTYSLAVLKERAEGGRELEMEFLAMEMDMKMGEQIMVSFDSKSGSESDKTNPVAATFRKLIGSKLRLLLDSSNHVESVEGLDELKGKLSQNSAPQAQMMTEQMFSEDYFKQIVDFSRGLPPKPVKQGQSWPVQMDIPTGALGKLKMNLTGKFTGMQARNERQCAALDFAGTMTGTGQFGSGPMGRMSLEKGKVSGTTWFDPELGALVESTVDQNMQLKMDMPMNLAARGGTPGAKDASPTLNLTVQQQITTTLVDVKTAP